MPGQSLFPTRLRQEKVPARLGSTRAFFRPAPRFLGQGWRVAGEDEKQIPRPFMGDDCSRQRGSQQQGRGPDADGGVPVPPERPPQVQSREHLEKESQAYRPGDRLAESAGAEPAMPFLHALEESGDARVPAQEVPGIGIEVEVTALLAEGYRHRSGRVGPEQGPAESHRHRGRFRSGNRCGWRRGGRPGKRRPGWLPARARGRRRYRSG